MTEDYRNQESKMEEGNYISGSDQHVGWWLFLLFGWKSNVIYIRKTCKQVKSFSSQYFLLRKYAEMLAKGSKPRQHVRQFSTNVVKFEFCNKNKSFSLRADLRPVLRQKNKNVRDRERKIDLGPKILFERSSR